MKAPLLSLLASAFVCSHASAVLYIYDPYTTGGGANYNAGQSLSSAHNMAAGPAEWAGDLVGSTSYNVSATGLSYSGLQTSGGSLDSVANALNTRSFSATNIQTPVYYSFLINFSSFDDYLKLGLSSISHTPSAGVIVYGDGTLRAVTTSNGYESSPYQLELNTTYLIVGKASFSLVGGNTSVFNDIWINPIPGDVEPISPTRSRSGSEAGSTGAAEWYSLLALSTPTYKLDEFRVGSTWADVTPVPEPQSMVLLLITGLAALAFRRRFRTQKAL